MGEPFTITVLYANGTTSTFTGCTGVADSGTQLTFTGVKQGGDGVTKQWTIMLSNVLEYSKQSE